MELELTFRGMTCLDCARRVERALAAVPGVAHAEVSYPAGRGRVVASDAVAPEAILRAVEDAGYEAVIAERDRVSERRPVAMTGARQDLGPPLRKDSDSDYDLLIIGSGAAGMAAAIRASEHGATAAVVEGGDVVGGTCVNVGCIPSKYLIEAARRVHAARSSFPGITPSAPDVTWSEVIRRKREIVESLRQEKYLSVLDAYEGVTLLRGRAQLRPGGGVRVDGQEVRARKILVATGTRPAMPPIAGLADTGALDSTSAMELEALPESMIVVGGGAIGLELGQAFARFGVRVVIVEATERIVPSEDAEVSAALAEALRAEGLEIRTGVSVTGVEKTPTGFTVRVRSGSLEGELGAEQLLVATGRLPNTEGLGLQAAGVRTDRHGFVLVDEYMRTTAPNIYAAGDVAGGPGFVYVAALGGGIAAQAALTEGSDEEAVAIDLSATPRVTFTDPQVAAVGMTEEDARSAGFAPKVTSLPLAYLPRAIVSGREHGLIKLVADSATDRLLGAHVVSSNAGDIIGQTVLAVRFGLRVQEIVSTLHPYLTWAEGIKLAGQTFTKDVAKLSCCA